MQLKILKMNKITAPERNVKRALILLLLLIVSPIILNLAFKALKIFNTSPKIFIAYGLLITGILLILYTVYFGFRTIKGVLDSLFKE